MNTKQMNIGRGLAVSHELLTKEEETELATYYRETRDEKAFWRLVECNQRFVLTHVGTKFQNVYLAFPHKVTKEDLQMEGIKGLIKAVRRYDPTRGFKLISYAVWWVNQAVWHYLDHNLKLVREPLNAKTKRSRINKLTDSFYQEFGRMPSHDEIAEMLEETPESLRKHYNKLFNGAVQMDAPMSEDSVTTMGEMMFDPMDSIDVIRKESLRVVPSIVREVLTEREFEVIDLYYGLSSREPMTLERIAQGFDLTRERVRQIKNKAMRKLRNGSANNALKAILAD